jgi:hypothetical protein
MSKYFLQKAVGMASACLITLLAGQTAHAQSKPMTLDFNVIHGNQVGPGSNFQIAAAPSGVDGPYIHIYTNDNGGTDAGSINAIAGYNANATSIAHGFLTRTSGGSWTRNLQILQNGQVQIGSRSPTTQTGYKLAVDGQLVATSMYVTAPTTWADFVFEPSYTPMTLPALENYLKLHKHLPAVPSAKEVMANGLDVVEMNAKLLQSVEELTLHVIALSKKVQELEASKTNGVGSGK